MDTDLEQLIKGGAVASSCSNCYDYLHLSDMTWCCRRPAADTNQMDTDLEQLIKGGTVVALSAITGYICLT